MNFAKFLRTTFLQNSFRRLLLCFQIYFEFPNLGFAFFKSWRVFAILHCACGLVLSFLIIFNSEFLKNFKAICILKFKARLKHKESYEKCHMTISFHVFNVSDMKWRGRYRQSCSIYSSLITLFFLCLPCQHFHCFF